MIIECLFYNLLQKIRLNEMDAETYAIFVLNCNLDVVDYR